MRAVRTIAIAFVALSAAVMAPADALGQSSTPVDGWVVLTLDDYRALRTRAMPPTPDPLPPPVDATLTAIAYDLRVTGETVTGEARLTVDVLAEGWVSIQVPPGILVRGARLDGQPTSLVDGNPPRILISRRGRSTITLDVVVPLESGSGLESMTLAASGSAITSVSLTVPRASVDLSVGGGYLAEHIEATAESRWTVLGAPGRPLSFSWKRRLDDRRATLPLRTRARLTELVALGEDVGQITASLRIEVVQGVAREIAVTIPEGVAVNQVTGASVADWSHTGHVLTVAFLEPVATSAAIVISAETRAPREGLVSIPLIRMPSAERETGGVAVDVVGAGEIVERQPRGFDPADASDLGDIVSGRETPSMAAFAFTPLAGSAARALSVTVKRYTPQAVLVAIIEEARYDVVLAEDGNRLVRARYAVRNNQRGFLAVTLPSASTLWSAGLAGRPTRPGVSTTGAFLLPLAKGRTGENAPTFAVEVVYLQRAEPWSGTGRARLELPTVDLPISRTGMVVHHSPRFKVETEPGVFRREADSGPWSPTLALGIVAAMPTPTPPPPAPSASPREDGASAQQLMDRFRKDVSRTSAGTLPVPVVVEGIGPSLFVAAELTPEAQAAFLELRYTRSTRS